MCFRCGPLAGRYLQDAIWIASLTCETATGQVQFRDVVAKLADIIRQREACVMGEGHIAAPRLHPDKLERQDTYVFGKLCERLSRTLFESHPCTYRRTGFGTTGALEGSRARRSTREEFLLTPQKERRRSGQYCVR